MNALPSRRPAAEPILRLGFFAALTVVLVASLLPPASLPPVHTGWDKADHALTWLGLGLLGMLAWPQRKFRVLAGLVVFGGAVELLQGLTGWRQPEWADLLADLLGLVGAVVLRACLAGLSRPARPR